MNVLLGFLVMAGCLMIQGLLILFSVRYYSRMVRRHANGSVVLGLALLSGVMLLLVVGILAQVTLWAVLFTALGEFDDIYTAAYHSAVNFATLGYGDIVMSKDHRILGPLEAISGGIMIGVNTAILMSIVQDMLTKRGAAGTRD